MGALVPAPADTSIATEQAREHSGAAHIERPFLADTVEEVGDGLHSEVRGGPVRSDSFFDF